MYCNSGYYWYEGVCNKCISNCSSCSNDYSCISCDNGYILINEKCQIKTKCNNPSCKINSKNECVCFNILIVVIFSVIILILILILIIYCIRKVQKYDKKSKLEIKKIEKINSHIKVISNENIAVNNEINENENSIISQKNGFDRCVLCQNEAKIISDCGCKFCNEHNIDNLCPICKKIIKNKTNIKFECGICLEEKEKLKHFDCRCALLICENCYNKFMKNSNQREKKCPGCRKIIIN